MISAALITNGRTPRRTMIFMNRQDSLPEDILRINDRLTLSEDELEWSFARSSGPGGQNVNKVNSKATLRWKGGKQRLPRPVWERFEGLAKRYITKDGIIVIQAQEHRDQERNMQACRSRLAVLLHQAFVVPKRRIKTKPTRSSQRRRLDNKRKQSQKKQSRRGGDW